MATTSMPRTVSDNVANFFKSQGLMSPIRNNYRRISTAAISRPPSRSTALSLSPGQPISHKHFDASFVGEEASEVEIPAVLHSIETYMYMGFTSEQAAILWDRYVTAVDEAFDGDFFDYVRWHIEEVDVPDATTSTDDWDACMRAMGINQKLRRTILLPKFDDIRFTATCKYWVLDAMEICYGALKDMDRRLIMERTRLQQLQKAAKDQKVADARSKQPKKASQGQKAAGPTSELPPLLSPTSCKLAVKPPSPNSQAATFSFPSCEIADNQPTPSVATTYATPSDLLGYTMLWRAGDRARSEAFYNQVTQEIKLAAISTIPGDFNSQRRLAYWTPQRETADRYAQWTKHKVDISEIVMIQVAIPESLMRNLTTYYLWCGERQTPKDEWRKLVYHSRRCEDLPRELVHIEQYDILIGHIASGTNRKFEQLTHWSQITDEDILTVQIAGERRTAIQWVFHTTKARHAFEEQCRGKIWLHSLGTLKIPPQS
ncbi:uncharacterized protein K441DRAFT_666276 [Cenococcum geophilum 1.58]|uniref:uncharacterized protein n=1 Tax=Cenococcum geophilum 1.58 TaxID=794803 RepID=UPI003590118C|nr:hypothetical protein K441DRAFT_666276 [Cenococcum geophilum 1.58]